MAKGNLFLGKARGSVGSVTFSQLNGKQISRAKATQVKNPKTDAQMIQRVIMNTTVQGYSGMQAIVDHSFQGVAYQGPSMNKFNSLNAKALREAYANFQSDPSVMVTFNGNGNKKISVNRWIISTGSLPRVEMKLEDGVVDTKQYESGANFIDSGVILSMPGDGQAPTYQELIAYYGLQAGDQLTLCALVKRADENDVVGCDFKYGRFILMPSDGDLSHSITDATVANAKNENLVFALSDNDYALCFADFEELGTDGNSFIYAAGIITSRLENSAWKRSSTTMEFATDDIAGVGLTMQQAIASYSGQDIDTNSPYYLNQAKRTAGGSVEPEPVPTEALGYANAGGKQVVAYKNGVSIKVVSESDSIGFVKNASYIGKTAQEIAATQGIETESFVAASNEGKFCNFATDVPDTLTYADVNLGTIEFTWSE